MMQNVRDYSDKRLAEEGDTDQHVEGVLFVSSSSSSSCCCCCCCNSNSTSSSRSGREVWQ